MPRSSWRRMHTTTGLSHFRAFSTSMHPPNRRSEAAAARMLLLAVKIAHEELGEKIALLLGCAVAARVCRALTHT